MHPAWSKAITPLLQRLGVGHLDTTLQYLTAREEGLASSPQRRIRVLILARQHYFETQRNYPVRTRRELAAVLELDRPELSPWPDAILLYHIASAQPGKMAVNIWCLRPQLLAQHRLTPWLILPEGLLHALASAEPLQQLPGNPAPWYLHRDKQGLLTSQSASGLYHAPATFCELMGAAPEQLHTRSPAQRERQLHHGLTRLHPAQLRGLWVARGVLPEPRRLARLATIGAVMVGLYLAVGSYTLHSQASHLQQQVATLRSSLDQQMQQEHHLQDMAERYHSLATPLQQSAVSWRLLSLLAEVLDGPQQFERLQLSGQRVELRATVPSASGLLSRLGERPEVREAHFAGPVQSAPRGDGERVTLVFELKPAREEGSHAR